jgi:thiamine biosynthesis lipoprotein
MPSCSAVVERVKPLLGTFVSIRLNGIDAGSANELLTRCFAVVAEVHSLMSFQEDESDVSRLNREAHRHPVQVNARTYEVLRCASSVSLQSGGVFDVTVAPRLVAGRINQRPQAAPEPDPDARWSDVKLLPDRHVRFLRPLWIDVSGIAKGYAVDEVVKLLSAIELTQACVNAGGDLAVLGKDPECVRLDDGLGDQVTIPVVELSNGSMASSGARDHHGGHVDGATREPAPARFVSVLASSCTVADALTKVVMARGAAARTVLHHFAATAIMSVGHIDWLELV